MIWLLVATTAALYYMFWQGVKICWTLLMWTIGFVVGCAVYIYEQTRTPDHD